MSRGTQVTPYAIIKDSSSQATEGEYDETL